MTNTLIFVILLYLIATNNFCKLFIDKLGIHVLLKKLEYANTPEGIKLLFRVTKVKPHSDI